MKFSSDIDPEYDYLLKKLEYLESGQEAISGGIIALIVAAIGAVIGLCIKLFGGGSGGGGGGGGGSSKITKTFEDVKKLSEKSKKVEQKILALPAGNTPPPSSSVNNLPRGDELIAMGSGKITVEQIVQENKVALNIVAIKPQDIPKLTEVLKEIVVFEVNFSKTIWDLFNKDLNVDTLDESFSENVLNNEKAQELADKFKNTTDSMYKDYEGKNIFPKC